MKNILLLTKKFACTFPGILLLFVFAACCPPFCPPDNETTQFTELDFLPNGTTNYDINCAGRRPTYSDVKLYTPQIMLSNPVDVTRTLVFVVKEDRTAWPDTDLGLFSMTILAGNRSPSTMSTPANGGSGSQYVPAGTPDPETQGFWLTCTAKCRVRGNTKSGDDEHAKVYIEMQEWQPVSGSSMRIVGSFQSPRRTVRCK